ncbi:MAG: diaminopimelate epimerase [Vicinamibacterales bacterium]
MRLRVTKAHAYGNDFLFVAEELLAGSAVERPALARAMCDRHRGIGADGLAFYTNTERGATMRLLNADGSPSEVSGNGVRCLATVVASGRGLAPESRPTVEIESDAGPKGLTLLGIDGGSYRFRASMGQPSEIRDVVLDVDSTPTPAVALRVGNPQCVVVGGPLSPERLATFGPALQRHPLFPEGVNFELAVVEAPHRVRILIWERGVGPTWSSGTGSCASAVAAILRGGAARTVTVSAPGGDQLVEWLDDGLYLTGEARVVFEGEWRG